MNPIYKIYNIKMSINYQELLLGNFNFEKCNGNLIIPIDKNTIQGITNFIEDLNNKNIDYKKENNQLIIKTSNKDNNPITFIQNVTIKIFDELKKLNDEYKILKDIVLGIGKNFIVAYVNNINGWGIELVNNNNQQFIKITVKNFKEYNIPFDTIENIKYHMIYVILCLVNNYVIKIDNNDLTLSNNNIVWNFRYLMDCKWITYFNNVAIEYETHKILNELLHLKK